MRNLSLILTLCLLACGCKPKPVAPTVKPVTETVLADLRKAIETDVAAGFMPAESIATNAVQMFEDDYDVSALTPRAIEFTRESLAAHKQAQATWPKITDCDRLDAAFAQLERAGIVSRQNFSDCGSCGVAEIGDEIEQAAGRGMKVRGYTFYHSQDTERAVDGGDLYLNYGGVEDGGDGAVKIGQEVSAALKQQGLEVIWNGTLGQRIGVKLDWKRRR